MRELDLDKNEYEKFCEDLVNKILKLNLKIFINNTSDYYPINLLHLGCVLFFINRSDTPLKEQLLINWSNQIKRMTNNKVDLNDLAYQNLLTFFYIFLGL